MAKLATPQHLSDLSETIRTASRELADALADLADEADLQLAAAAHDFIAQHSRCSPLHLSYGASRNALEAAVHNAVFVNECAHRTTALVNSSHMPQRRLGEVSEILRVHDQRA